MHWFVSCLKKCSTRCLLKCWSCSLVLPYLEIPALLFGILSLIEPGRFWVRLFSFFCYAYLRARCLLVRVVILEKVIEIVCVVGRTIKFCVNSRACQARGFTILEMCSSVCFEDWINIERRESQPLKKPKVSLLKKGFSILEEPKVIKWSGLHMKVERS